MGDWANFSKKLELLVEAEIWNLNLFEYVELDGDFPCFPFWIGNTTFSINQFGSRTQIFILSWNLVSGLFPTCKTW